jgi:hypothetical protein
VSQPSIVALEGAQLTRAFFISVVNPNTAGSAIPSPLSLTRFAPDAGMEKKPQHWLGTIVALLCRVRNTAVDPRMNRSIRFAVHFAPAASLQRTMVVAENLLERLNLGI